MNLWRPRSGAVRVGLAFRRLIRLTSEELYATLNRSSLVRAVNLPALLKNLARTCGLIPKHRQTSSPPSSPGKTRPVIFISACVDDKRRGDWKYCGGIKEFNYLAKLLRNHGYEAYIVTYDGTWQPWMIEHQPHLSLEEFRARLQAAPAVRCVTSFAIARAFTRECPKLYFWDMELASTDSYHLPDLARLYRRQIQRTAAISRTVQAWHMAHFETPCTLIPNLLDETVWSPDGERCPGQVGYMIEGEHTAEWIALFREKAHSAGLNLEFVRISGLEPEILASMRTCEVFLSMNEGKDPLWGEGCPRTILEASSTGAVVLAFDLVGNLETLQHNFNGLLFPRMQPERMAAGLVRLYQTPGELERLRANALSLVAACHTLEARWSAVKEFLQLDDLD